MTYTLMIAKDGQVIAEREASPDMVIVLLAEMATNNPPEHAPETKQRKWHKAQKKGNDIQKEIEGFHAQRRQHPETARIEELLVEGKTTAEVIEQVQVSAPTVGVIRARLKKEGKLF